MGVSREFGVESTEMHFQKSSYPMQGAILWTKRGEQLVKIYFHNFADIKTEKNAAFTGLNLVLFWFTVHLRSSLKGTGVKK